MSTTTDRSYFLRRADQCRRQADAAADRAIRSIHEELAVRYDRAAERAGAVLAH